MQTAPVTVPSTMRLNHVAALMRDRAIDTVVVTRRGRLVGLVTQEAILHRAVAKNAKPSRTFVRQVMTPVVTVAPDTDLREAARLMVRLTTRTVAVVEAGDLVGIVTEHDILRISPALIDMGREVARMGAAAGGSILDHAVDGYCENCTEHSDELLNTDGRWLCGECLNGA